MPIKPRNSYSETFIVWNDCINLVGALIPSTNGRASVSGTIRFKNGEKLSFSSQSDDYEILYQKLLSLCQVIAKFYSTNVIHRKDRLVDSASENSVLLEQEQPLLN